MRRQDRRMMLRAAALLPLLVLAACATAPRLQASHAGHEAPVVTASELLIAEVEVAMARHDDDAALELAGLAVSAAPADAAPKEILARALQSAGRFDEAVVAWDAALAGGGAPRARLNRALAMLAAGRVEGAKAALRTLPADGDTGLGLALAGDPAGLSMLETAAAAPESTATVRQNLALAHALAGNWSAARSVALRDLPASAVPERLSSWARLAAASPPSRIALMLGIVAKAPPPLIRVAPPALTRPRLTGWEKGVRPRDAETLVPLARHARLALSSERRS